MVTKKKASVKGEKRFRPKRPHVIQIKAEWQADRVVPIDVQTPPPLRDRSRDHLWRAFE